MTPYGTIHDRKLMMVTPLISLTVTVDQMGVDQMGVDKMGVDKMGVDEMGTHRFMKLY